jgi:hypothetical protein
LANACSKNPGWFTRLPAIPGMAAVFQSDDKLMMSQN